jgi:ABC-type nitrate/sulfonate/bicarbonate transport system ATPase subunit
MNRPPLVARDVTFRWLGADEPLFSGVSAEFSPGTVTAVMGANGAGKTTFLELISRRLVPEHGALHLGDSLATEEDFNYLPQDSTRLLFSHLTLAENIALRRETGNVGLPALEQGLFPDSRTLTRYPAQCSGGQRQRAVVCRALLDLPYFPATLLDESFSHLSRDARTVLGPAMRQLAQESNAIVLFVSHDVFESMLYGDRLVTLARGHVDSFDTRGVTSEDDCWRESTLRDEVLHSLRLSEGGPP